MTERPILFSGAMVRAILAGAKSQTRRVVAPSNAVFGSAPRSFWKHASFDQAWVDGLPEGGQYLHVPCHRGDAAELERLDVLWGARGQRHGYRETFPDRSPCDECRRIGWTMTIHQLWPRVEVGMRLWVRESWMKPAPPADDEVIYRADLTDEDLREERSLRRDASLPMQPWKPSIHMPRWASRLTLEITSVRVERLQEISEEDARAEGVEPVRYASPDNRHLTHPYRDGFHLAWDAINGKRHPWASDPWVWALTFKIAEA